LSFILSLMYSDHLRLEFNNVNVANTYIILPCEYIRRDPFCGPFGHALLSCQLGYAYYKYKCSLAPQ
jgi:hypothetical protein